MKPNMMLLVGAMALMIPPLSSQGMAQAAMPAAAIAFTTEQPATEWLAHVFIGADVLNAAGETVGDVRDLLFDRTGRINMVVLGVGGFLGVGEKHVAVPFSALTYTVSKDGVRIISIALSKDELMKAPAFKAVEKTRMDAVRDKASDIGHKTVEKAVELKDQAAKKIEDMKTAPVKQ